MSPASPLASPSSPASSDAGHDPGRPRRGHHRSQDSRASTDSRQWRILLAEDDADMRDLLSWTLRDDGYDVVAVADGKELCRRLADHFVQAPAGRFDLVISDIRMPAVSGLEVIRDLQEFEDVPTTILITAFGDEEVHRQAEALGVLLLDKPFDIDDLLAAVGRILRS